MSVVSVEYEPIVEIVEDILGDYRMHNEYKGQMSFDCPVCSYDIKGLDSGDGKGNLEVNYIRGVYKCWSCAETHQRIHPNSTGKCGFETNTSLSTGDELLEK